MTPLPNHRDRRRPPPSTARRNRPVHAMQPHHDDDPGPEHGGDEAHPHDEEALRRQLRRSRRGGAGYGIAAVAALALAGGLAFFAIGRDGGPKPASVATRETPPATPPVPEASPPVAPRAEPPRAAAPEPAPPVAEPAPPPVAAPPAAAPAPAPRAGPPPAEVAGLVKRSRELIGVGDIGAARLLLERASGGNDGAALFALAETYDPVMLGQWGVRGVRADADRARTLYQKALDQGVAEAQQRLSALR